MTKWKEYLIAYYYDSEVGERISSIVIKGRTIAEAEKKASAIVSGRGVMWRLILNETK